MQYGPYAIGVMLRKLNDWFLDETRAHPGLSILALLAATAFAIRRFSSDRQASVSDGASRECCKA